MDGYEKLAFALYGVYCQVCNGDISDTGLLPKFGEEYSGDIVCSGNRPTGGNCGIEYLAETMSRIPNLTLDFEKVDGAQIITAFHQGDLKNFLPKDK